MRIFKVIFLTSVLLYWPIVGHAVETIEQCSKIIIAGDAGWEPYTVISEQGIAGIGIDLATQTIAELDIPVVSVAFDNRLALLKALRTGDIDILVSTYPNNDVAALTDLLQPDYNYDPITVAVKITNLPKIASWEDLGGHHGVMEMTFTPDQSTQDFFINYLSIRDKMSMGAALDAVLNGSAYYVVGSELQLRYALAKNNLEQSLAVVTTVNRPGAVHMAFVKNSTCKQYAAFLTKRLQDYKNNGTVEKIENTYIVR